MFASLKTIDTAFRQVKSLVMLFTVGVLSLGGVVAYLGLQVASKAKDQIYVLDNGSLLTATARNAKDNRPVEAENHVRLFHEYFLTLDPDEKVINQNINRALYLADNSAKRQYENLKEKGYYNDLISANISQKTTVDSVQVDFSVYPIYARCFAHQTLIRSSSITYRNLLTDCYLREVARSVNNPHGFIIEQWRVLKNEDISTNAR